MCWFCGEPRPFRWIGGLHCSPWRASQGQHPLRAEDWPSQQAHVIRLEALRQVRG